MEGKLYFAYGSNINLDQMAVRCPTAQVVGPAMLADHELLFRGNAGGFGVATIEPLPGETVHGLLWKITPECERSLDIYEGYPCLYEKETITVRGRDGAEIPVMVYVMTNELWRNPTMPSASYYAGIAAGYAQNGLPVEELNRTVENTRNEIRQDAFFQKQIHQQSLLEGPQKKRRNPHER